MLIKYLNLFYFLFLICNTGISQSDIQRTMQPVVLVLIDNLKNEDSIGIFNMYDTAYVDLRNQYKKEFIMESIRIECKRVGNLIKSKAIPKQYKFNYYKDSSTQANMVMIPLLNNRNVKLNWEKCNLVVAFPPDRFFDLHSKKILNFYLLIEQIKSTMTEQVKIPPRLLK
jgi:hypothetical protein